MALPQLSLRPTLLPLPLLLLLLLLLTRRCESAWLPVGAPLSHDAIWASALAIDYAGGASAALSPLIAFGFENFTRSGVTIGFSRFNATSAAWMPLPPHESQFPQQYDKFELLLVREMPYLALRIDSLGLSSILRGRGGSDGWDGSWAFDGYAWDAQVNSAGDVRMASAPSDNSSLALLTYNHTGWDAYPAADAWGPPTVIVPAGGVTNGTIDNVVAVPGAGDDLFIVYAANGALSAVAGTMSNSSVVRALGGGGAPCCSGCDDGATAAWGAGGGRAAGVLCVTGVGGDASLSVWCLDPAAASRGAWAPLGRAFAYPAMHGLTAVAVAGGAVIAAAVDASNSTVVRVGVCVLAASGEGAPLACDSRGWVSDDVLAAQPITNVVLRAAPAANVSYMLVSEGTQTGADAVVVLRRAANR